SEKTSNVKCCKCLFHIEEIERIDTVTPQFDALDCCKCLFHIEEIERCLN
ncbi:unnamed protein product, partial [marine sediment metagenome]